MSKSASIKVTVSPELRDQLTQIAAKQGRSVSNLVATILERVVLKRDKQGQSEPTDEIGLQSLDNLL
jgi:predicted transcriptional regulator